MESCIGNIKIDGGTITSFWAGSRRSSKCNGVWIKIEMYLSWWDLKRCSLYKRAQCSLGWLRQIEQRQAYLPLTYILLIEFSLFFFLKKDFFWNSVRVIDNSSIDLTYSSDHYVSWFGLVNRLINFYIHFISSSEPYSWIKKIFELYLQSSLISHSSGLFLTWLGFMENCKI